MHFFGQEMVLKPDNKEIMLLWQSISQKLRRIRKKIEKRESGKFEVERVESYVVYRFKKDF
jgi:hypothetical protein